MTNSLDEPGHPTAADPLPERQTWAPERQAKHRRNLLLQIGLVIAVLAVGGFGLLRHNYPAVRAESGVTYQIVAVGQRRSAGWSGTYVQYLSRASASAGLERELADVSPIAQEFAAQIGDSLLEVIATRRRFSYGLFFVDEFDHIHFHRDSAGWVRE